MKKYLFSFLIFAAIVLSVSGCGSSGGRDTLNLVGVWHCTLHVTTPADYYCTEIMNITSATSDSFTGTMHQVLDNGTSGPSLPFTGILNGNIGTFTIRDPHGPDEVNLTFSFSGNTFTGSYESNDGHSVTSTGTISGFKSV